MVRTEIHVDYDFDPTDPRELVARSENVFVGWVGGLVSRKARESSIPGFSQPETQFLVRVFEVLVSGGERPVEGGALVTVNQVGGRSLENGETYTVVDAATGSDDGLLERGRRYLLATRCEPGWQTLTAQPGGNIPLDESQESQRVLKVFRQVAGVCGG